ncbi:MAG TPA: linear amide C-N hydrolase [Ruminococcus sp.]|nr:linear amide C-N hydrolase [Ruminococcus sp.]
MKGSIKTLRTFKKLSGAPLYTMDYTADYQLDRLLKMGAGSDTQFANNVCRILLNGLPVKVKPEGACSSFVASTPDGHKLFARNFDYKSGMAILIKAFPKKGYRSVALSNLGHIGFDERHLPEKSIIGRFRTLAAVYSPLDGMNENGFAVAVNTAAEQVTRQDTGKTPVMTTLAIRLLLDRAANVEEAVGILDSIDMRSSGKIGYHFHMADRSGDSAIVEYIDNKMVVIRREPEDRCFCLTNFTLSTDKKNGTGKERFEIMQDRLKEKGAVMTSKEAMELLEAAKMDGHKYYEPGHMYYDSITQWSVVYDLSKCTAAAAVKSDFERKYDLSIS